MDEPRRFPLLIAKPAMAQGCSTKRTSGRASERRAIRERGIEPASWRAHERATREQGASEPGTGGSPKPQGSKPQALGLLDLLFVVRLTVMHKLLVRMTHGYRDVG